jgi:MFS family permease
MLANYRLIFQGRSFRLFWLGFTFSVLGDSLTRIALTWYVYEQTKSAEALGWLAFWYAGPVVVGGLAAGWLLDRFDRRAVMIVDNAIRGTAVAAIPVLHALGLLAVWHVYVVAGIYGLLMMIALAGSPAMIPSLVERDSLDTANALETLSWTLGGVLGPALAGLLITLIGAPNVLIVDAVSYFAFALALWQIRVERTERTRTEKEQYSLGHAVRLLLTNQVLFSTTFMFMAFNIGGGGFISVWLPILADQNLGGGSELYGALWSVWAAGEVVSALWVGGRRFAWPLGALICVAQMLSGLALLLLLFSSNAWLVMLGLALLGAFSAPLTIWAQTLRMQVIPEELRGRTFALLRTLMQSGNPIGGAIAGALFPVIGMTAMVGLTALVVGLPGLIGYQVRLLRTGGVAPVNDRT